MKNLISIALMFVISACKTSSTLAPIYDSYPQLGLDRIESASYELVKVASLDGNAQPNAVSFIKASQHIIVDTGIISHTMIDSDGYLLSSYVNGHVGGGLPSSGVFFAKDHYVDWPLTGDKNLKQYSERINGDTLSQSEFEHYFNRAEVAVYKTLWQYEPDKTLARCLLKIDGEWVVIETELPEANESEFDRTILGQKKVMHGHQMKNEKALYELEKTVTPWYEWRDMNKPIHIKESQRIQKSNLRISSNQVFFGWHTTSYFNLKFGNEILSFKASAFERKKSDPFNFYPDMALHIHPDSPHLGILIVEATKGNSLGQVDRKPIEAGIYVIRKKNKR